MAKERVTVSLEPELVAAGAAAVASGRAESLSAWVSDALSAHVEHERRLQAMADAVLAHEAEHGPITDDEIADQARRDRDAAAALRNRRAKGRRAS